MRVLDLFCGEGGAGKGYMNSGHEVTGVDIDEWCSTRYPGRFYTAEALRFVTDHADRFDLIHASPPCQAHSVASRRNGIVYPELVEPTRKTLIEIGKPFVIENVMGAPLQSPTLLCWTMFRQAITMPDGLMQMQRHRLFETNWLLGTPGPCRHNRNALTAGAYGGGSSDHRKTKGRGGFVPVLEVLQVLMEIDWMSIDGLHQAIPPFFTEYIGKRATEEIDL